jgi:hypothetical protein
MGYADAVGRSSKRTSARLTFVNKVGVRRLREKALAVQVSSDSGLGLTSRFSLPEIGELSRKPRGRRYDHDGYAFAELENSGIRSLEHWRIRRIHHRGADPAIASAERAVHLKAKRSVYHFTPHHPCDGMAGGYMTGGMNDDASKLAEFLIEQAKGVREEDIIGVIGELFPDLTDEAFFRGYAIAEELLVTDIQDQMHRARSHEDVAVMLAQYAMLRDHKK